MIRILVVDDHLMARLAVSQMIEQADASWRVCGEASDGKEALEKAAELKPDFVILDLSMPGLDGITAGRQIRELLPNTPILVYTFMVTPQLQTFVKAVGLQGAVQKADTRALIAEIRRVLSLAPSAMPAGPVT